MTHDSLHDDRLGELPRATSTLTDGSVLTHDWFATTIPHGDTTVELMVDATDPASSAALLPGLHAVLDALPALVRIATDAVVHRFSEQEPPAHELDEAAADLQLEALEASAKGTIVFHFVDTCGAHFPEGYWPAAHLSPQGEVRDVTVEA
ncbi:hypothetical protein ACWGJP_09465 [Microbacterium sp. NPDC055903]